MVDGKTRFKPKDYKCMFQQRYNQSYTKCAHTLTPSLRQSRTNIHRNIVKLQRNDIEHNISIWSFKITERLCYGKIHVDKLSNNLTPYENEATGGNNYLKQTLPWSTHDPGYNLSRYFVQTQFCIRNIMFCKLIY